MTSHQVRFRLHERNNAFAGTRSGTEWALNMLIGDRMHSGERTLATWRRKPSIDDLQRVISAANYAMESYHEAMRLRFSRESYSLPIVAVDVPPNFGGSSKIQDNPVKADT